MAAVLVAVVGPSGAGKDSLLAALKARAPGVHVVRRHITRPAEAGGEPHVPQTHESFAACLAAGGYALHWQAHGMCYGIPSEIDALLAKGETVVFNGSRAMLAEAGAKYPQLLVAEIVVDRPILAARLAARGRHRNCGPFGPCQPAAARRDQACEDRQFRQPRGCNTRVDGGDCGPYPRSPCAEKGR